MNEAVTRCGFVAVIGAANAGKSTLLNAMMGTKVSIVTPKAQTTRMRIRGIVMRGAAQIIVVDTPGIFTPRRRLDRAMVSAAWEGAREADITAVIVDAARKNAVAETQALLKKLPGTPHKTILILNKIDRIRRDVLLPLTKALNDGFPFDATFMVSALKKNGVEDITEWLAKNLPPGPPMYPEDQLSDLSERMLAAEITREKLFLQLHEELPYGLGVETESWEVFENGAVRIGQVVLLARAAHKPIVIGKGGARLRQIGQAARLELESLLGCRVHLNLIVRVRENWADDPARLTAMGLDPGS